MKLWITQLNKKARNLLTFYSSWLPAPVQNLKESNPDSVPEDKNTGLNDGPRSGLNRN